jgi:hypothetical protein
MRKRLGSIGLVGALCVAVTAGGIATASPSSSPAEAVAAKKKCKKGKKGAASAKKKGCKKKKKSGKQVSTITAEITSNPAATFITVSGLVSGSDSCTSRRTVQLINLASGAVIATSETGDFNVSFSLLADPEPPAGTQVQVAGVETNSCQRSLSNIMVNP